MEIGISQQLKPNTRMKPVVFSTKEGKTLLVILLIFEAESSAKRTGLWKAPFRDSKDLEPFHEGKRT